MSKAATENHFHSVAAYCLLFSLGSVVAFFGGVPAFIRVATLSPFQRVQAAMESLLRSWPFVAFSYHETPSPPPPMFSS